MAIACAAKPVAGPIRVEKPCRPAGPGDCTWINRSCKGYGHDRVRWSGNERLVRRSPLYTYPRSQDCGSVRRGSIEKALKALERKDFPVAD